MHHLLLKLLLRLLYIIITSITPLVLLSLSTLLFLFFHYDYCYFESSKNLDGSSIKSVNNRKSLYIEILAGIVDYKDLFILLNCKI